MIVSKKERIEKHQNGKLAYYELWAKIAPLYRARYPDHRKDEKGNYWIRVGWNYKCFDNGQLAWQMEYDNNGVLVKGSYKAYRKDGTPITH